MYNMEGIDYVVCRICGKHIRKITNLHTEMHGLSMQEYREKFPDADMVCQDTLQKMSFAQKHPELKKKRVCVTCGGPLPKGKSKYCGDECSPHSHCVDCGARIGFGITRCKRCHNTNPEMVKKRSEGIKKAWANSEKRAHIIEGIKESRKRESYKRKMSEWATERWSDPDEVARQSERMQEFWDNVDEEWYSAYINRAKTVAGPKISEALRTAWDRGDFADRHIAFSGPTNIEVEVASALDAFGLRHQSQWRPEDYSKVYDEFVWPDILIEVNGSYWHTSKEAQERDLEKARWAYENGYKFIAIWDFHLDQYGADFLVEKWILPLNPEVDSGEYCYMPRLF